MSVVTGRVDVDTVLELSVETLGLVSSAAGLARGGVAGGVVYDISLSTWVDRRRGVGMTKVEADDWAGTGEQAGVGRVLSLMVDVV